MRSTTAVAEATVLPAAGVAATEARSCIGGNPWVDLADVAAPHLELLVELGDEYLKTRVRQTRVAT